MGFKNLRNFDYRGLCEYLARGRTLVSCGYYVGTVRAKPDDTSAQEMRKKQQQLFGHLESSSRRFSVKRGYLMDTGGKYHEKGVDVQIAVDLIVGAYENLYDTAIVLSSDSDLIPAIKQIKSRGKRTEYVGFSNQPSLAMQKHATESRLLIRDDLVRFDKTLN